jgi:hypothetical protein
MASLSIGSCSKNGLAPNTDTIVSDSILVVPPSRDTIVIASNWVSFNPAQSSGGDNTGCSSCTLIFQQNVPELDANIINGGKVLVYVKYANVEVAILPTGAISLNTESYLIDISTTPQNFTYTLFKYILIPSGVLAKTADLDFSDYDAVVAYYKLPE